MGLLWHYCHRKGRHKKKAHTAFSVASQRFVLNNGKNKRLPPIDESPLHFISTEFPLLEQLFAFEDGFQN